MTINRQTRATTVEIRPTSRDELDALVDIYLSSARHHAALDPELYRVPDAEAAAERLGRRIDERDKRGERSEYLSAVVAGRVVGSAGIELWETAHPGSMLKPVVVAETGIAVLDEFRGRGIGHALMAALERWAIDHGVERVVLDMSSLNDGAIRLYEELGYRTYGRLMRKDVGR